MKKGFTLVESLVAVAILTLAIAGAFSAAQSGLSSANLSKNQVIAFYLAQEAVEQLKNIRDQNIIAGNNWLTGISAVGSDPCYFGNACTVDTVTSAPSPLNRCVAQGSCPVLNEDPVNGFYGYNAAWTPTIFKRQVTLASVNANEIAVLVTISWPIGTQTQTFRIRDNILNW